MEIFVIPFCRIGLIEDAKVYPKLHCQADCPWQLDRSNKPFYINILNENTFFYFTLEIIYLWTIPSTPKILHTGSGYRPNMGKIFSCILRPT